MLVRPATHSGSWYSADKSRLSAQLSKFFASGQKCQKGARVLVGPHAGFTYSGQRLAETFSAWDTANVKRIFILGPSHHVYFKDSALVSHFDYYATPLGKLKVDTETTEKLVATKAFKYMSSSVDEEEHLFEMHAPFIAYRCKQDGIRPQIVPIMISSMSSKLRNEIVDILLPYFQLEENTFVVLSDFCHWGRRFGYTEYVPGDILAECGPFSSKGANPIYKSIEFLDKAAMEIATAGSAAKWDSYIDITGNTICGQRPIAVVLRLVEEFKKAGGNTVGKEVFEWIGYSQSSKVTEYHDSSVSYASGYIRVE